MGNIRCKKRKIHLLVGIFVYGYVKMACFVQWQVVCEFRKQILGLEGASEE